MTSNPSVPGWLVFVGSTVVALVFAGGLVGLLVAGRTVPEQLWVLAGVIATAYFGSGPFSIAHQGISATNRALIDTVNHAIASLRDAMPIIGASGTTTDTTGTMTSTVPPTTGEAAAS